MEEKEEQQSQSIYVKFPRDKGFVVYPVELRVNPIYPRHWDLYGSVDHYIKHSTYPKIAALGTNKSYGLRIYQIDVSTKGRIVCGDGGTTRQERFVLSRHSRPWFRTPGLPQRWRTSMILLYDPLGKPSTSCREDDDKDCWSIKPIRDAVKASPLLASERNYRRYLACKKKSDDMVAQWRSLWPQSPVPRCIASPVDIDDGGLMDVPLPLEILQYSDSNNKLQQLPLDVLAQQREFILVLTRRNYAIRDVDKEYRKRLDQYHLAVLLELDKRTKLARLVVYTACKQAPLVVNDITTTISPPILKSSRGKTEEEDNDIASEKRYVTDNM